MQGGTSLWCRTKRGRGLANCEDILDFEGVREYSGKKQKIRGNI